MAWVIEGNLYKTPSKFRNFHGRPAVIVCNCVNTSNFETHKSRYLQPKGSFFVFFVGFSIAKLLFSIKEWGKKVKLGQF